MKQCLGCGDHKAKSEYYNSSATDDGLNKYCKQCCKVNRSLEGVRKRDKRNKLSVRQRYRAKQNGLECDNSVTLAEVFKRARGVCGVCDKWVQPKHASMDHIVPMIKGGGHIYINIQLTHLICNLRKGAKDA